MTSALSLARSATITGDDLPDGWAASTLGEVCQVNPSKPRRDEVAADAEVTFVPMPAVDADSGTIATPQIRGFDEVRKGFTAFRENDVIMAKITPCMENGKAAIAKGLRNGLGFGSTEFHVFRSREAVLPEYVYYFIRQESFRSAAEMEMTGSVGQKRVPAEFIESAEIPISPLAEQKRIVEAINRVTTRVDAAHERLAKVPAILKRFRQAVLAAACSGRLTEDWRKGNNSLYSASELYSFLKSKTSPRVRTRSGATPEPDPAIEIPEAWEWSQLDYLCAAIVDCPHSTPKWSDAGRLCIRTTNFRPGHLDLSTRHYVSEAIYQQRIDRLEPQPGDIVYSREGGILGIACIIPPNTQLCLGQRMMLFRTWPEVRAEFLMHCLNSSIVLDCVRDLTGGTASPHLNVGDIKQFQIPLPPTDEQAEIVRRVEALMKPADAIEQRIALATARADKTTQAILAKAFRGELVSTEADLARAEGRTYESAAELLARIADTNNGSSDSRRRQRRVTR